MKKIEEIRVDFTTLVGKLCQNGEMVFVGILLVLSILNQFGKLQILLEQLWRLFSAVGQQYWESDSFQEIVVTATLVCFFWSQPQILSICGMD